MAGPCRALLASEVRTGASAARSVGWAAALRRRGSGCQCLPFAFAAASQEVV